MKTKHLDIGCGSSPRNPYNQDELYGVDISIANADGEFFKSANLTLENIPFADDQFDSVSAFDFLEHVPRQLHSLSTGVSRVPFIELMNEVWRVLKPNGVFYALTPCFPHQSAFVDPTHVNYITDQTHKYFCGDTALGKMYGFTGDFKVIRSERVIPKDAFNPTSSFKSFVRKFHRKIFKPADISHIVWVFVAIK